MPKGRNMRISIVRTIDAVLEGLQLKPSVVMPQEVRAYLDNPEAFNATTPEHIARTACEQFVKVSDYNRKLPTYSTIIVITADVCIIVGLVKILWSQTGNYRILKGIGIIGVSAVVAVVVNGLWLIDDSMRELLAQDAIKAMKLENENEALKALASGAKYYSYNDGDDDFDGDDYIEESLSPHFLMDCAARRAHVKVMLYLGMVCNKKDLQTSSTFALINTRNVEVGKLLLKHGADVKSHKYNIRGHCVRKHWDVVKLFVKAGAPIDNLFFSSHDYIYQGPEGMKKSRLIDTLTDGLNLPLETLKQCRNEEALGKLLRENRICIEEDNVTKLFELLLQT